MRKTNLLLLALATGALALSSSCKKDELPIQAKSYHFDKMGELLEEKIGPGCVGMQYAISEKGTLRAEGVNGLKQMPIDGPQLLYTLDDRKSVHSASKTITAAALIHALQVNNISMDSSIAPYVPSRWNLDPAVLDITFYELLTHTSGLRGTRDTYNQMRDYMAAGGFSTKGFGPPLSQRYANVNFTLMRILIPMLNPTTNFSLTSILLTAGEQSYDAAVSASYVKYVQDNVFVPAGMDPLIEPNIWDGSENNNPTRHYNFSDPTISGYIQSDQTLSCGAGGWYLNANDYAAFLASLFHNKISNVDGQLLINESLGMFNGTRSGVNFVNHNGAFTTGVGTGGRMQWVHIPNTDIDLVVQINSANNAFTVNQLLTMMIDAYIESYY